MSKRLVLAVAALSLLGAPCRAADWYVDAVTGDDVASSGTSPLDAWRTVTRALASATSADVVHIAPGHYDAALGELFPLRAEPGVTLEGAGRDVTEIHGGSIVVDAMVGPESLTLRHLAIDADGADGCVFHTLQDGDLTNALVVEDCLFKGCRPSGIVVDVMTRAGGGGPPGFVRVALRRNVLIGTGDASGVGVVIRVMATLFGDAEADAVLENNLVTGFGAGFVVRGGGLEATTATARLRLAALNNTFVGNLSYGAHLRGGFHPDEYRIELSNNIFALNGAGGLGVAVLPVEQVYRNNAFFDNATANYVDETGEYTTADAINAVAGASANLVVSPGFVDVASGDFHLAAGSPLVDAGVLDAALVPADDFELDPRPVDGDGDLVPVPDIGADEAPAAAASEAALLRNDEVMDLSPLTPSLETIFPLDPSLPPPVGDRYIDSFTSGDLDPNDTILTAPGKPLVFYGVDPARSLRLVKTPAGRISVLFF